MPQSLEPCWIYVDGAYIRARLVAEGISDEFDPYEPAKLVGDASVSHSLPWLFLPTRVFYYDALDESPQNPAQVAEAQRLRSYFDRLRERPYTHVVTGYLRRGKAGREQKGVDVQLAVDALEAAVSQRVKA